MGISGPRPLSKSAGGLRVERLLPVKKEGKPRRGDDGGTAGEAVGVVTADGDEGVPSTTTSGTETGRGGGLVVMRRREV